MTTLNNIILNNDESENKKNTGLSVDGLTASWFLFSFSRRNKKNLTKETFKTILPDGSLQVVNIEVESSYKGKDGKSSLPGAFAQDVLLSMVDSLVNKIQNELPEFHDIKKRKGQFLPEITQKIPQDYTTLYFKNKDIAENMGMTIKNARITNAIEHLHRTSIKITGTIFKDGNVQKIKHQTYYLQSITAGLRLRGGMAKQHLNRVTFDDMLIKQLLGGYIAKVNKEKLLSLKSGAPRKLYTLLATKKMSSSKDRQTVSVTETELEAALQITKKSVRKYLKKYVDELIKNKILKAFQAGELNGSVIYIFEFTNEELLLQGSDDHRVKEYFSALNELSKTDLKLKKAIESDAFDVDEVDIEELIKDFKCYSDVNIKRNKQTMRMNKVVAWCDQLLWSIICGQKDMSLKRVLVHCLKTNNQPSIRNERRYIPVLMRVVEERNKKLIQEEFNQRVREENRIKKKIEDESEAFYEKLTTEKKQEIDNLFLDFLKRLPIKHYPKKVYVKNLIDYSIDNNVDLQNLTQLHTLFCASFFKAERVISTPAKDAN